MDVKSAFLNGIIQEEVYFRQPRDFENPMYCGLYMLGLRRFARSWVFDGKCR
jgi:hypothetical protein